jgi:hypothetical protein
MENDISGTSPYPGLVVMTVVFSVSGVNKIKHIRFENDSSAFSRITFQS